MHAWHANSHLMGLDPQQVLTRKVLLLNCLLTSPACDKGLGTHKQGMTQGLVLDTLQRLVLFDS
jgi:hypothetical protein